MCSTQLVPVQYCSRTPRLRMLGGEELVEETEHVVGGEAGAVGHAAAGGHGLAVPGTADLGAHNSSSTDSVS